MRLNSFSHRKTLVLGVMIVVWGLFSFALGISQTSYSAFSFPFGNTGYGIWCGLFFVAVGGLNIALGLMIRPTLVLWAIVMNLLSIFFSLIQTGLGIASAHQDYNAMYLRNNPNDAKSLELADHFKKYLPMINDVASYRNLVPNIHDGSIAVSALLAWCGIIVCVCCSMVFASCARVTCCPDVKLDLDTMAIISPVGNRTKHSNY